MPHPTAIKVVRKKGYQYLSFWMSVIANHPSLYKENEWTTRPDECGPLTVFDNCQNALRFIYDNTNLLDKPYFGEAKIFNCEYKPSEDDRLWYPHFFNNTIPPFYKVDDFPIGTIMADEVMLTDEVVAGSYSVGQKFVDIVENTVTQRWDQ